MFASKVVYYLFTHKPMNNKKVEKCAGDAEAKIWTHTYMGMD